MLLGLILIAIFDFLLSLYDPKFTVLSNILYASIFLFFMIVTAIAPCLLSRKKKVKRKKVEYYYVNILVKGIVVSTAYIGFLYIACKFLYLVLKYGVNDDLGDKYGLYLIWFGMFLVTIVMSLILMYILKYNLSTIHKKWNFLSYKDIFLFSSTCFIGIVVMVSIYLPVIGKDIEMQDFIWLKVYLISIGISIIMLICIIITFDYTVTKKYLKEYGDLLKKVL